MNKFDTINYIIRIIFTGCALVAYIILFPSMPNLYVMIGGGVAAFGGFIATIAHYIRKRNKIKNNK